MAMLGWLLGSLLGKLADPVTWVAMMLAALLAFQRWAVWWILLIASVGAAAVGIVVADNARLLGLQHDPGQLFLSQTLLIGVWCVVAYAVVYLLRRRQAS